jgi:hypothetical protein
MLLQAPLAGFYLWLGSIIVALMASVVWAPRESTAGQPIDQSTRAESRMQQCDTFQQC